MTSLSRRGIGGRPQFYHPDTDKAIINYVKRNPQPTYREIAEAVGLPLSTCTRYLHRIIKTGHLQHEPYTARSLRAL